MIKLLLGPTLGVTLFFFLSYYQPFVETSQVEATTSLEQQLISPLPQYENVIALTAEK